MSDNRERAMDRLIADIDAKTLDRRNIIQRTLALGLGASAAATAQGTLAQEATSVASPTNEIYGFEIEPAQHEGGTIISAQGGLFGTGWSLSTGGFQGISETLVEVNPKTFQVEPLLATSWEASEDSMEWTFHLREGVTWHDGEPFTAEDVKFSIELHAHPDNLAARIVDTYAWAIWVDTIEILDPLTVKMTLVSPVVDFALYTYVFTIMAKHVLEDVPPAELVNHPASTGSDPAAVVFTGPFKFQEYVPNEQMTLVRNDDYWGGAPHLDQWIVKEIPDTSAQVVQLQSGDVDFVMAIPPAAASKFDPEDFHLYEVPHTAYLIYYYQLDPDKSPYFQDERVRQALLYAIDREAMLQAVYFGYGKVPIGLTPPASWAANPDGIEHLYPYDPDKANQLLDDAGWVVGDDGIREKDGLKLQPNMLADASNIWEQGTPAAIQEYWRAVGVEMKPEILASELYGTRLTVDFDFDTALVPQGSGVTIDRTFAFRCKDPHGTGNRGFYCNERVDELIDLVSTTADREERIELLTEMQNIILQEAPIAPLVWMWDPGAVSKRVHNVYPTSVDNGSGGYGFNAKTWWIEE